MIELYNLLPANNIVALAAIIIQLSLMRILVARDALCCQTDVFTLLFMALDTVNLVFVLKRIPSNIMIVTDLLQDDHLVPDPLVIAMAFYADACVSGMGALLIIYPFSQFLMTVKAFTVRDAPS